MSQDSLPAGPQIDQVQRLAPPESHNQALRAAEHARSCAGNEVCSLVVLHIIQAGGVGLRAEVAVKVQAPVPFTDVLRYRCDASSCLISV